LIPFPALRLQLAEKHDDPKFALSIIATVAALVAYLQWVTAHQKVVVDLFDRRRKAFELVEAALRPVFREAEYRAMR
jgi:hypothetical protein